MSKQIDKIKKVSIYVKWFILLSMALTGAYLCQQLFIAGEVQFYSDMNFDELWVSGYLSKVLLSLIIAPIVILAVLSVYFVIKVLNLFQQGILYSRDNFLGYLGFVWSQIALFFYSLIIQFVFAILNTQEGHITTMELEFDLSSIITLLFMLVILYLLKIGKEVDDENKEFI